MPQFLRENGQFFPLDILEEIFKKRAVESLESGMALERYNGLNFLWILGQIDSELTASKKKYYRKRPEAVQALSSILWGYTSKDCLEMLDKFFPKDIQ